MTKWIQWMVLSSFTGSPIGSIAILLVFWWTLDRFTLHILPDPIRGFLRWKRVGQLETTLANNPNDRRARFELADVRIQQRRFEAAVGLLRPNIEAGDEDVPTLYLFGIACFGAKNYSQAERVLLAAKEDEPDYRSGDIDLALGRVRLAKGDLADAEESLNAFIARRRSSVEGRVVLAQVKEKSGDKAGAQKVRDEAWSEYISTPPVHRRRERFWAWRAKPARPLTYGIAVMIFALLFARFGAPALTPSHDRGHHPAPSVETTGGDGDE